MARCKNPKVSEAMAKQYAAWVHNLNSNESANLGAANGVP